MKTLRRRLAISFVIAAGSIAGNVSYAQQKVPITFHDFHGYTGAVEYLNNVAAAYPEITELMDIGKSSIGRSICVLVISNMKTGTTVDAQIQLMNPRAENVPSARR